MNQTIINKDTRGTITAASIGMTRAEADRSLRALGLSITRCSAAIEIVRRKKWPPSVKAMTQADHEITRDALTALRDAIAHAFDTEART